MSKSALQMISLGKTFTRFDVVAYFGPRATTFRHYRVIQSIIFIWSSNCTSILREGRGLPTSVCWVTQFLSAVRITASPPRSRASPLRIRGFPLKIITLFTLLPRIPSCTAVADVWTSCCAIMYLAAVKLSKDTLSSLSITYAGIMQRLQRGRVFSVAYLFLMGRFQRKASWLWEP